MSLNAFLARSHARLHELRNEGGGAPPAKLHIVLGNEAADPDSCVCAIAAAAALDMALGQEEDVLVAPLILVPRGDFKLQLDRVHLLRRAQLAGEGDGPSWTPSHVSFADELDLSDLAARLPLALHLVDHNKLSTPLASFAPHVASIIDHHAEEGLYTDSVPTDDRVVELGIGSCSSLVAEHIRKVAPSLLSEPPICALLLGAILLDTVNLEPAAKAQKPREASIANELLAVCAESLGLPQQAGADVSAESAIEASRAHFFNELLEVKADTKLLLAFPTADLLRQDYKEEVLGADGAARVGVGSVVLPLPALLARQSGSLLQAECAAFAAGRHLDLLLMMAVDLPQKQRYLLLHCADAALRTRALSAMEAADVRLTPLADAGAAGDADEVQSCFAMGNYKVSRKVLLPILRAM